MKRFIKHLFIIITNLWKNGKALIDKELPIVYGVTKNFITLMSGPTVEAIEALFPGLATEFAWLAALLPKVADIMKVAIDCSPENNPVQWIMCIVNHAKALPEAQQQDFFRGFTRELTKLRVAADPNLKMLTNSDINFAIEVYHKKVLNP